MSIIALDVGDKWVGVAISFNSLQARALNTINRKNLDELLQIIKDSNTSRIIIGLPKNRLGATTEQTNKTMHFKTELMRKLSDCNIDAQVFFEDERLTSIEAKKLSLESSKKVDRNRSHSIAAQIILEQYLAKQS